MAIRVITPEMEKFFTKNAFKMSKKSMAKHFGVSESVVDTHFRKNNIVVPREVWIGLRAKSMTGKTTFTKKEDRFIKKNYLTMPVKTIASCLNRSGVGVMGRLKTLNLVIPQELADQRKRDGMYRKGQVPANKGLKQKDFMSEEAIARTKATRFKKGQVPPNTIGVPGTITIRSYGTGTDKSTKYKIQYIQLELGKWMPLHTYNWEKANGKVPKGYCLWFKDRNPLNAELENLEIISRSENVRRNHGTFLSYPEELQTSIRLVTKINKELKTKQNVNNQQQ